MSKISLTVFKLFAVPLFSIGFIMLPLFLSEEASVEVPVASAAEPSVFPAAPDVPAKFPISLSIPSIKLNSPVIPMGLIANGELGVPSGKTNNVGWYKNGTIPGKVGSAVMDAHVYAALKNLHNVKVGDDIYVSMDNGTTLHFVITEKKTLPLASISTEEFYNRATGRELHLITCAGNFSKKTGTYSHRLLVYATLVK